MLCQAINKGQEATLGIEPGVCAELGTVWLQALDDSADAKLVVALQQNNRMTDSNSGSMKGHVLSAVKWVTNCAPGAVVCLYGGR